jgi:uncharacterized FlgJ-related protein
MLKIFFNKTILFRYAVTILGLLLIVALVSLVEKPKVVYVQNWKRIPVVVYKDKPDMFTEDKLISYLKALNIKYPEVVFAQAVIESGNFTSKKFKKDNNLFGMKKARSRATLALNSEGNYARFNTWRESVIDYALYQSMFVRKIKSRDAYISHLADSYATSPNYSSHLIKVINEVKDKF